MGSTNAVLDFFVKSSFNTAQSLILHVYFTRLLFILNHKDDELRGENVQTWKANN